MQILYVMLLSMSENFENMSEFVTVTIEEIQLNWILASYIVLLLENTSF